jgi:hypothetical protein
LDLGYGFNPIPALIIARYIAADYMEMTLDFRRSVFHRYTWEEMSGPLPARLYKVLSAKHARRLVEHGEMMWSTLTWFQNMEDIDRGDYSEGTHRYFPEKGLEVNWIEHNGLPDVRPEHGLVSKAAQSNHIFIYSLTHDSTLVIGYASDHECVEIFNTERFVSRLRKVIAQHRSARAETFIHDTVTYWSPANPPKEVWALPHRLTMHKRDQYASQCEYRLAFGTRANVFDYENVECVVVDKNTIWSRLTLDPQVHRLKLRLGTLRDCCRLL